MLCLECGKEMAKGLLVAHNQTQHGMAKGVLGWVGDEEDGGEDPRTLRMAFPTKSVTMPCPVKGCSGWAATQT